MLSTTNMYEAAFCKVKGFEIGKISYDKKQCIADIQIEGNEEDIKHCIDEFYMNGTVDANRFTQEITFLKFIIGKKARV